MCHFKTILKKISKHVRINEKTEKNIKKTGQVNILENSLHT